MRDESHESAPGVGLGGAPALGGDEGVIGALPCVGVVNRHPLVGFRLDCGFADGRLNGADRLFVCAGVAGGNRLQGGQHLGRCGEQTRVRVTLEKGAGSVRWDRADAAAVAVADAVAKMPPHQPPPPPPPPPAAAEPEEAASEDVCSTGPFFSASWTSELVALGVKLA